MLYPGSQEVLGDRLPNHLVLRENGSMLRFSSLGQIAEKSMLKEEGFMLLMVSGAISHQGS